MKLHSIYILLALVFTTPIMAQENEKAVYRKDFTLGEYAPMSVSYYGNLITHPGLKVGFDWNLFLVEKTKDKKKKTKTVRNLYLVSPSIAFYTQKSSHKGVIITADLTWRHYTKNLFFTETSLGIGYYRKYNSGETWEENADGSISNIGRTSRGYFAPSLSLAYGKQFTVNSSYTVDAFARVNASLLMGYNAESVPEFSLELGARMALNWGIKRGTVKTKTK